MRRCCWWVVLQPGGIKTADGESLKNMYALNFETAYFAARPAFLQMQKQPAGGRIILVGSRASLIPKDGKNFIAYALSKSLLFKLAEYLNVEGASHNVVTSVIVPSTIDTPANRQSMPKADFSKWVKPEEIGWIFQKVVREPSSILGILCWRKKESALEWIPSSRFMATLKLNSLKYWNYPILNLKF